MPCTRQQEGRMSSCALSDTPRQRSHENCLERENFNFLLQGVWWVSECLSSEDPPLRMRDLCIITVSSLASYQVASGAGCRTLLVFDCLFLVWSEWSWLWWHDAIGIYGNTIAYSTHIYIQIGEKWVKRTKLRRKWGLTYFFSFAACGWYWFACFGWVYIV